MSGKEKPGWQCGSVVEHLPSKCKVLSSTLEAQKKKLTKEKAEEKTKTIKG
jgi:hypothetical protein